MSRKTNEILFSTVDSAPLAVFRILFGAVMLAQVVFVFTPDMIERFYSRPSFHFSYPLFGFVRPWPGDGMRVHIFLMGVSAAAIMAGLFYRAAAAFFFLSFTYVFLLDKTYYNNHYYLISLLSFLLIFVNANDKWSLDAKINPRLGKGRVPFWQVLILRFQIVIVYFYGGVAKLNPDWLAGEPMRSWLGNRVDYPFLGHFFTKEWAAYLFSYGGILFDCGIAFLLPFRRTRWPAFAAILIFNAMNGWLFGKDIQVFPYMMIAAMAVFVDRGPARPAKKPARRSAASVFIGAYIAWQLFFPLRHWLYPGDVAWTEEGHRFSWRMKLTQKNGDYFDIEVIDPKTGTRLPVDLRKDLTRPQFGTMTVFPDMILQYVHFLRDRLQREGIEKPVIHVYVRLSLNGRPAYDLIDSRVNLAEAETPLFSHADWILPLPK